MATFWNCNYDSAGQVISGKKHWQSDGTPVDGQQFYYTFDTIGNRTFGNSDTRQWDYYVNTLNQYISRTVPGYVNLLGTATNTATVTMWSPQSSATYTPTTRKGDYFRGEMPFNNSAGPVWATITNLAVLNNGSNPDIVTNSVGRVFLPKTPEVFGYDLDGNLTNDGRWAFYWDAENRLTNMTSLSSAPAGSKLKLDFAYDTQGRRIQKIVSTNNGSAYVGQYTNKFVYDGWNLVAILNPQSSILQSFVWSTDLSGSQQGAGGVGGLLETINYGLSTNYVAYDGNGNVAALVKASDGTITANYEYGPFGELIRASGLAAKANPFRFSSKYQDDESDLLYYGYRFYNQSQGRWLSRDPSGERGGPNLYAFVKNSPIQKGDVWGLDDFNVVGKSFINGVGEPGHLWRFGLDLGLPFSVWPWLADTRLAIFSQFLNIFPAFHQNPSDDSKDGNYRLYANTTIHIDCNGSRIANISASQPDMVGGAEMILPIPPDFQPLLIAGTINSRVSIPQRTDSSATVVLQTWGRPNALAEPGMQWVGLRTSVHIWHEAKIEFSCCGGSPSAQVLSFRGSRYPSRRLWVNGDRKAFFDQGPLSSLWHADPRNPFAVAE